MNNYHISGTDCQLVHDMEDYHRRLALLNFDNKISENLCRARYFQKCKILHIINMTHTSFALSLLKAVATANISYRAIFILSVKRLLLENLTDDKHQIYPYHQQ